jgi:hypothetical protein
MDHTNDGQQGNTELPEWMTIAQQDDANDTPTSTSDIR